MSYDLNFWRGMEAESPKDLLAKFSRLETADGVEPLEKEEVIAAFRRAFQGQIEVELSEDSDDHIFGRLFALPLYKPLRFLWITCGWEVLKQPRSRAST